MKANEASNHDAAHGHSSRLAPLVLGAIGVVYGDIGTSPLYTLKEVFNPEHGMPMTHDNVLGVLSLVFWSLVVVVSLKYVVFIMRADNRGEGGIMALTALALRKVNPAGKLPWWLAVLGMFGAALFYGDGAITPAISVLSAVEGLAVATPAFSHYVVPITLVILIGLFAVQKHGTAAVGALFGPVMVLWFFTLGTLGLLQVMQSPAVLEAVNPYYAVEFFVNNRLFGFLALGSVVLAVTGAEALYADMGHFGRKPIALAWFAFVFPAIYLNYLGQGALLLSNPEAVKSPFFLLAPEWLLYPMVILATAATIIASQAVISGAFSLTRQAVQLGYAPRLTVMHTSEHAIGQVYVPAINWTLLVAVCALVLGFKSSSSLASAYGIAVTGTMMIDTVLAFVVVSSLWNWSRPLAWIFLIGFISVDLAFFLANTVKIVDGGWFPIVLGVSVFTVLATWRRGRAQLHERIRTDTMPLDLFIQSLFHSPPHRVPGTAIFMTSNPDGVPRPLLHNILHNKVLHERVVMFCVTIEDIPHVSEEDSLRIEELDFGFYRVYLRYGFKDEPDIPRALELCSERGFLIEMMETTFFLGRETLIQCSGRNEMAPWRERLFITMFRNAGSAVAFFKIPVNRVVEFGTQVEF